MAGLEHPPILWISVARPPISPDLIDRAGRQDGAMAGHSKFKNIQFRKGAQDKKRSKLFSKLAREITAAAKLGLPDPAMNPRLRGAIQAARAVEHAQG